MVRRGALLLALAVALPAAASDDATSPGSVTSPGAEARPAPVRRFHLFLDLPESRPLLAAALPDAKRLFHQTGDPDSLFTLGGPTPGGELHLKAAFELNDIVLRAIAPDGRVDPSDTRARAAGDYRALDAGGRPYQLRLGARLVW